MNPFYQNTKWEKHKPKPSPQQKVDQASVDKAQAGQTAAYGAANKNIDTAQGTLGQFEGKTTDSPYYKSLLATGTDATTNAYNNAKSAAAARANAAGFGNTQPAVQGANNEINAQETAALGRLPAQAEQATAPLQLQAAGETGSLAGTEAGMGNALGSEAVGYEGQATDLAGQYMRAKNAFNSQLLGAGLGAASNIWNTNPYGVFGQQ